FMPATRGVEAWILIHSAPPSPMVSRWRLGWFASRSHNHLITEPLCGFVKGLDNFFFVIIADLVQIQVHGKSFRALFKVTLVSAQFLTEINDLVHFNRQGKAFYLNLSLIPTHDGIFYQRPGFVRNQDLIRVSC